MNDKTQTDPNASPLRLKQRKTEEVVHQPPHTKKKAKKTKKQDEPKPAKASGKFGMRFFGMSIGSFIVASLIFGGFLYHQVMDMDIITPHQASMARGITVVAFYVILVIEAFHEDLLQGVLALFLPPYAFVYGLLFADAGPIRGLTMALLLFFIAEIYATPPEYDALVPKTIATINGWVEAGQQKLINPDKADAGFE